MSMSTSTSPTAASIWRRNRAALLVALVVVATAIFGVVLSGEKSAEKYLDPANGSLRGSKGLAELLRRDGHTVERTTSVEAAVATATGDRLIVITSEVPLDDEQASLLARSRADLLVVGRQSAMSDLVPEVEIVPDELLLRSREPDCDLPAARAAGSVYLGDKGFESSAGTACYFAGDVPTLLSIPGEHQVTVVGSGEFMTNLRLAEDGNAALALNLMSTRKSIIWLVPAPPGAIQHGTAGSGGRTLGELIPAGVPRVMRSRIARLDGPAPSSCRTRWLRCCRLRAGSTRFRIVRTRS